MTNRERVNAIFHYEKYDRIPIVHFGYWWELCVKWMEEGHITQEILNNNCEGRVSEMLGFEMGWGGAIGSHYGLIPGFEHKILERREDGFVIEQTGSGLIIQTRPGAGSIPSSVGTLLNTREDWETLYLPKLQWSENRVNTDYAKIFADDSNRTDPHGIFCGSLYGSVRDMLGVEGLCYLYADDEDLFAEVVNTIGDLCYRGVELILKQGGKFDFGHFWEDICFKNGPLVNPEVFRKYCGPNYKKITDLLLKHGVDIVSLDCDGKIDELIPIWLENGVNTMFPIEVGTWDASIEPWRKKYGKAILGIGGMDKRVLSLDYAAIDAEVERLRRLVDLGGFIPCPDHRLPPETKWENVQYYTDRMRKVFC